MNSANQIEKDRKTYSNKDQSKERKAGHLRNLWTNLLKYCELLTAINAQKSQLLKIPMYNTILR